MRIEIDDHAEYDQERLYICQLITNTDLLRQVFPQFNPDLLSSDYTRIIGKWIAQHFKQTNMAPGKDLMTIFARRSSEIRDKDVVKNISLLLKSLSSDWAKYKIVNIDINSKAIIGYLEEQNARRHLEDVEDAIDRKDFKKVPQLAMTYQQIQPVATMGESIFENPHKYIDAFNQENQRLFTLQGDLGKTVGYFRRGEFSAVVARTKGGKSYFKWYCSRRGAAAGLKGVYANLEINKDMMNRRIWQDLTASPEFSKKVRLGFFDEDGELDYKYIFKKGPENMSSEDFEKAMGKQKILYKTGDIYPLTFSRGKMSIGDLKNQVKRLWEYYGYQADFVVLDYMDIIRADTHFKDKFEMENDTWEKTAAWAAEDNIGIISSTQGNLDSFDGKSFSAKGVGGVYKKLSHPDKLIALYSGELDEEQSISRVKRLFGRGESPNSSECVVINGMDFGRYYVDSRFADSIGNLKTKKHKRG